MNPLRRLLFVLSVFITLAVAQSSSALTLRQELAAKGVLDIVAVASGAATVYASYKLHQNSADADCEETNSATNDALKIIRGVGITGLALNSVAAAATALAATSHFLAPWPFETMGGFAHFAALGVNFPAGAMSAMNVFLAFALTPLVQASPQADIFVPWKCVWKPFVITFATTATSAVANAASLLLFHIRTQKIFGPCIFVLPSAPV